MGATARDVALRAGVSVSTVSRALSSPGVVAARTRTRVLRAAEELGYHPHRVARQLSTGRTHAVGLVVPDLENPFFASVTKGVHHQARGAGLAAYVADTDEDVEREREIIEDLASQVDGLVLASPRSPAPALVGLAERLPVVLVNRQLAALPAVVADNRDGIRQAVSHLHALGHRRIAYAGGPATSWSDAQRREGLRYAAAAAGDLEIVDLGAFRPGYRGGVAAADLVIATGATALIAFNDLLALGVLGRLRERRVVVPDQVSVVGFDDIMPAALVAPSLTTVAVPLARLGRVAVDLFELADPVEPTTTLAVDLVVRESTAEVPARTSRPSS